MTKKKSKSTKKKTKLGQELIKGLEEALAWQKGYIAGLEEAAKFINMKLKSVS